jgi:hypothetical protein
MTVRPPLLKLRRKYELDESYWLVRDSRVTSRHVRLTLRRSALFFMWGRVPKIWELSFVDRMRGLEKVGLTFDEILCSTLPELLGEDPSLVLRVWIGRRARCNPERFARSISKMFGASARNVLGGVDSLVDEASLLAKRTPRKLPIQVLLDAIQRADAAKTSVQLVPPTTALSLRPEQSIQLVSVRRPDCNSVRRTI